jgi:hypothetical protein
MLTFVYCSTYFPGTLAFRSSPGMRTMRHWNRYLAQWHRCQNFFSFESAKLHIFWKCSKFTHMLRVKKGKFQLLSKSLTEICCFVLGIVLQFLIWICVFTLKTLLWTWSKRGLFFRDLLTIMNILHLFVAFHHFMDSFNCFWIECKGSYRMSN